MSAVAGMYRRASLAGGIFAASGKPHTVKQALAVYREVIEKERSEPWLFDNTHYDVMERAFRKKHSRDWTVVSGVAADYAAILEPRGMPTEDRQALSCRAGAVAIPGDPSAGVYAFS